MPFLKLSLGAALLVVTFCDFDMVLAPVMQTAYAQTIAVQPLTVETEEEPQDDPLASNCYLYVQSLIPSLPHSSKIETNTPPYVGAVVFMDYPHYAIITKLEETGFWVKDTNWGGPGYRTHFLRWDNKHIKGFWSPVEATKAS